MRKLSTDLIKSGSFTGSFSGSVTGLINSASYALTASTVLNAFSLTTGSTYSITSSWSNNSVSSSFSRNSISSSYSNTASNLSPVAQDLIPFTSSTYSLGSATNKWKDLYVSSGSIYIGDTVLTTSGSSLYSNNSPIVTLNTASGQIEVIGFSSSLSSSFATNAGTINNTSSNVFATTGSNTFNGTQTVQGDIRVIGNLIAQQYVVSSSVSYFTSSNFDGSTKFGDSALDTHQFTGSVLAPNITGSLLGSSSYSTTSSVALTALTSSYINIATNAVSSSYAATSSYILNAVSSSFSSTSSLANTASYVLNSVSSSFASTASYNLNSVSSSYSLTSSYAANAGSSLVTGSTYPITSSWANNSISSSYATNAGTSNTATSANSSTSASYALTASFAANAGSSLTTGSTYPITSSWSNNSVSSSYALNSSTATSATSATTATSSSFASTSSYVANTVSSSYALTASYAMNASGGGGTSLVTGSTYPITSSWSINALTASYAITGGSGSIVYYDVLLNNLYDNVLLTYERKPEQLFTITSNDYGTQADGVLTVSSLKNINTDLSSSGRTVADGVSYLVTAITSSSTTSTITISGSSIAGLISGDEVLLINVQGDTTYYTNVGNYEFLRVSSISTNTINFSVPISRSYGQTDNSTIGNQKVILQRVPNYSTVTITSTGTLTATNWSGSSGGIVVFKCDTLINSGSINADGKGFRFGVGGIRDTGAGCTEYPTPSSAGNRAESYQGLNSVAFCSRLGTSTVSSIGGGGGGGAGVSVTSNRSGGGGGGGANRTNGSNGSNASSGNLGASGGTLYNNNTSLLIFGGGGGGGGRAINGVGGNGGSGGGIVLIYANNFNNNAIINATGSRGVNGAGAPEASDDGGGGGGGGAGGVVLVKSNYVNAVGTFSIAGGGASSGGAGTLYGTGGNGGAGGLGNQLLKYTVANVSVASVTASFESSSLVTTTAVDPNIEDGFVDNYYVFNTLATVVSASWDSFNKAYYNVTGSVNSLTSYPIRTISSSVKYPTIVRAIVFAENNDDDPWTINQDLKFYLSNNGGVSYTTASLIKRGIYETGKFIYSNDIGLVSQNTASLTYKLELSSSKVINVYGVGLVWPIDLTFISSSASASFASTSSYALTASYAMNGGSGGSTPVVSVASLNNQTILYNFSSSQEATITGLTLTNNNWGINVVEEWNSASLEGDLYYNSCSLLMHFSGSNGGTTFTDNSQYTRSFTGFGNAQVSTAQSKFGGSSLYCDGSGDYITTTYNTTAFDWWTTDYTIECFIYPNNSSSLSQGANNTPVLIGNMDAGSGGQNYWSFGPTNNKQLSFYYYNGGTSFWITSTEATVVVGQWNHIAMTKNSTGIKLFINGTASVSSASVSGTPQSSVSYPLTIGQYLNVSVNAYIDEVRITKGVARYTASFVVPTSEFQNFQGNIPQYATKYIGLVGGLNDSTVDYGVEKLSDSSLKIRKMSTTGQPLSGSGQLSASVDRVYVNVLNYTNISVGSTLLGQTFTALGSTSSYALSRSVINPYEIVVAVDGAVQSFNDAYSVTSSTINFTETIPSGSLVDIRYLTTPNVNSASYAVTSSFAQTTPSGKSIALSFILG